MHLRILFDNRYLETNEIQCIFKILFDNRYLLKVSKTFEFKRFCLFFRLNSLILSKLSAKTIFRFSRIQNYRCSLLLRCSLCVFSAENVFLVSFCVFKIAFKKQLIFATRPGFCHHHLIAESGLECALLPSCSFQKENNDEMLIGQWREDLESIIQQAKKLWTLSFFPFFLSSLLTNFRSDQSSCVMKFL